MKLNDLAASPAKNYSKVLENYFGRKISCETIDSDTAGRLLARVRNLIAETRTGLRSHTSEQDPKYLQLMVVEQALVHIIAENTMPATGQQMTPADQQKLKSQQLQATQKIKDPKLQQAMKKAVGGQNLSPDEQKTVASAAIGSPIQTKESRMPPYRRRWLAESEVQQAQVVLAAQDMVDQVQKMIEECTSVQFKDLPALVDQIKNEVGFDQAVQFNTDATNALGSLVQAMQTAKQQLEQAVGVVTGQQQEIAIPDSGPDSVDEPMGPDDDFDLDADMDIETPDMDVDIDTDVEEPIENPLGRKRVK